MKIELELKPCHWWIEQREPYDKPDITCAAMVRFKSEGDKYEIEKEEEFGTIEEACAWVKEQIA